MKVAFQKWGNSLALRVPKAMAQKIGASDGKAAEISVRDGKLVIEVTKPKRRKRPFTLDELVAAITPKIGTKKSIGGRQLATKSGDYCPDASDLIWIDLSPTVGHEQSGHRPALVLTSTKYNAASGLCVACPITRRVRG
jgi:antitoxin component of MazEF toxin-antitoxin module